MTDAVSDKNDNIAQGKALVNVQITAKPTKNDTFSVLKMKLFSVDNFRIVFAHLSCIRNSCAKFVEGIRV
ncbi:hypothetical protein MFOOBP_25470 [Escherichia coli]|nr:hypothetical protein MFOOBP_25470 [Escherichia coli]